jgi:uncharacterized protein YecE (DUF72 family)
MTAKRADIRIGISGWTYPPWRGVFFPKGLKQRDELCYAARQFRTIEINGTFYGLQKPKSFDTWRDGTPEGFMFSLKAPRFITHIQRLRGVEISVANFLASGLLRLGPKLGPILWQFPPNLKFDSEIFETFLALLPHDTEHAAALAKKHDARMKGRNWCETDRKRPLRHAVEIRHESFRNKDFIALLRHYKIALVCADTVEWPRLMDLTADFIYCRLHGSEQLYASGYGPEALDDWATRIRAWARGGEPADAEHAGSPARPRKTGRDVFMYFDNDMKVKAPANAAALVQRLS